MKPKSHNPVFMLAILAVWVINSEVALSAEPTEYDCIIEPFMTVEIGSPVDGVLEKVYVDRGDFIAEGDVVANLRSEVERATVALARARAKSNVAIELAQKRAILFDREEYRATTLHSKKVIATSAMEKAQTESQLAKLQLEQARQEKNLAALELRRARAFLSQRTIKSPLTGIVVARLLSPGEYVYDQANIIKVAQIDPLYVEVFLPISVFNSIKKGMTAKVKPVEPVGGIHNATVTVIDKVFDAASGTFGVRLNLLNPDSKMPAGINCTVTF